MHKFSYLKELLLPRVRLLIDDLHFTSEGYSRAKSILLDKFDKSTEIATARIKCITWLSVIQNSHPNRIHGFHEKLVTSVQILDTMNKLKERNRYVRLTLDKLSCIRADLVRINDGWLEALRKRTTKNPKIIPSPEKVFKRANSYQLKNKNYKHRDCA